MKKSKMNKFISISLIRTLLFMLVLPALAGTARAESGPAGITLTPGEGPFQVKFHNNRQDGGGGLTGTLLANTGKSTAETPARPEKTIPGPPPPPINEVAPNGYSFAGWYTKTGNTYQQFDVNETILNIANEETSPEGRQIPLSDIIPLTQKGDEPTFALLNLILSVVCFLMTLITTIKVLLRKHDEKSALSRLLKIILSNIVGLASILILTLTQAYPANIIWLDGWTIYHTILFVISTATCIPALGKGNDADMDAGA